MAEMVPDALEGLTPQERNKVQRMLRLEVAPFEKGYELSGAFVVPASCILKRGGKDITRCTVVSVKFCKLVSL